MQINVCKFDNYCTFALKGRLDLSSSSEVKEQVLQYLKEGHKNILLNMSEVDFINSSGLGTLVSTLKLIRTEKGRIALCSLAPYVQEIFEITQLSHIFDIYESEAEAGISFSPEKVAGTV